MPRTLYGLHRGAAGWLAAARSRNGAPMITTDPAAAWSSSSLDTALDQQVVIRLAYGINIHVRALPHDEHQPQPESRRQRGSRSARHGSA